VEDTAFMGLADNPAPDIAKEAVPDQRSIILEYPNPIAPHSASQWWLPHLLLIPFNADIR